jgi:lipopolysaccharide transport system permease protein
MAKEIMAAPETTLGSMPLPRSPHQPVTVIRARNGWSALDLNEIWEYRDLLYYMTWRNLQGRYRQMALGPLWIVIGPLLSMILYTFVFGRIAKLPSEGVPYPVFTYVALLPWNIFTDSVSSAANSLLSNKQLLSKVYFPRLIPIIAAVLSHLVDFVISFAILVIMLLAYQIRITWGVLLLPLLLFIAILAGLAVGLWFAGIIVRYRDFATVSGYMIRFWMYATPVVYSMTLIPDEWRLLYKLNPMTGVVEGFRWAILGTSAAPDWTLLASFLLILPVLVGGLYNFKRVERNIVDIA